MKGKQPSIPPAGSGLRERRKTATRRELILAGQQLFGEKGLYESSIEDLTTRAGIAKGTLYTYFADKDELVRAVASNGFEQLREHVAARVRGARSDADALRRVVRAHLEFFEGNSDLMRVFHQVRGMLKFERAAWKPLRNTFNAYIEGLAEILATIPNVGLLSLESRLELARLLFGVISGVSSVATASGSKTPRTREADVLVRSLAAIAIEYISLQTKTSMSRSPQGHHLGQTRPSPRRLE